MTTTWKHIIGIVGGLGPHSHIHFEERLLKACGQVTVEQDYPPWVVVSFPFIPDRTEAALRGGASPVPALRRALEAVGKVSDFAVVACNTAHVFLTEACSSLGLPVLDLIEETVAYVERTTPVGAIVGLLATEGTLRTDIYKKKVIERGARVKILTLLDLDPSGTTHDALVTRPIYGGDTLLGVKRGALQLESERGRVRQRLREAVEKLKEAGAGVVITACTEISAGLQQAELSIPLLDPLDVAARAAIEVARGTRTLPGL